MVYPADAILPDATAAERSAQDGVQDDRIAIPYNCLVVRTAGRTILIDTGLGRGPSPDAGRLRDNLAASGVSAESVDTVVLTHGHPDHIGGLVDSDGKLSYPNASYVMSETDWRFWTASDLDGRLSIPEPFKQMLTTFAQTQLPAIAECVELAGYGHEAGPGVRLIDAAGHTPGHMAVQISSGDATLLAVADAVVHPSQLRHPEWRVLPDLDPAQTAATRKRLLDRASTERELVLPYHFPFPGLGRVEKAGLTWTWAPFSSV